VCAPEVKKKFQNRETKKRCVAKNILWMSVSRNEVGDVRHLSGREVVAPASRRHFLRRGQLKKLPAGRRRYKTIVREFDK
jgi:hypothetical protein